MVHAIDQGDPEKLIKDKAGAALGRPGLIRIVWSRGAGYYGLVRDVTLCQVPVVRFKSLGILGNPVRSTAPFFFYLLSLVSNTPRLFTATVKANVVHLDREASQHQP